MTRPDLARDLLALAAADDATRERLAADGSLFDGYRPEMETVHRANVARLSEIIDEAGWPGVGAVGEAGAEAAWRIAQHAIGEPAFMRRALELVRAGVEAGDLPAWQAAYLEDRVRSLEGRPQRYGTQHDWDEVGVMGPYPEVEDPAGVDARRAAMGLGPLAEASAGIRAGVDASTQLPPADVAGRRAEMDAWAWRVGWRGPAG